MLTLLACNQTQNCNWLGIWRKIYFFKKRIWPIENYELYLHMSSKSKKCDYKFWHLYFCSTEQYKDLCKYKWPAAWVHLMISNLPTLHSRGWRWQSVSVTITESLSIKLVQTHDTCHQACLPAPPLLLRWSHRYHLTIPSLGQCFEHFLS